MSNRTVGTISGLSVLLALATVSAGDTLATDKGLVYSDIVVVDVVDCQIIFSVSGRRTARSLKGLKHVTMKSQPGLNRAEDLARDGKWSQASAAYDQALPKASPAWLKRLVAARKLRALDEAGSIDKAVEQWLAIVDENKLSAGSLSLRPSTVGKPGSQANAKAVSILEARLKGAGATRPAKALSGTIKQLLMEIYKAQGDTAKAAALAGELSGAGMITGPQTGRVPTAKALARFKQVRVLMDAGKAVGAIEALKGDLRSFSTSELPEALYLLGKAQIMAGVKLQGDQRRGLLLDGGLNLMWVAAEFPSSAQAPRALLEAARLHTLLSPPNVPAARLAYRAAATKGDSKVAGQAAKALEAIGD